MGNCPNDEDVLQLIPISVGMTFSVLIDVWCIYTITRETGNFSWESWIYLVYRKPHQEIAVSWCIAFRNRVASSGLFQDDLLRLYMAVPSLLRFHIQSPHWFSLWVYQESDLMECQAGLPVLFSSFPIAFYFTHDSDTYLYYFLPLLPPLCPQVRSLHLHSFPVSRFINTIFLESINIC